MIVFARTLTKIKKRLVKCDINEYFNVEFADTVAMAVDAHAIVREEREVRGE